MNRCARCFSDLSALAVFCPQCAQANQPDFEQLVGQIIGERYRLERRLSQGGLATVLAATDLQTRQPVVVKISNPAQLARREQSFALEPEDARNYWNEMLARMEREAEVLAGISHPHIVKFYGTGLLSDDLRYVVMEFLHGYTLREALAAKGRLTWQQARPLVKAVTSALAEVHARNIVHRDITPRNIFLVEAEPPSAGVGFSDRDAEATDAQDSVLYKLIDFGISKFPQPPGAPPFTQHSVLSGTVAYASPEQCQSLPLDHRTDIYSLGVVMYEMLTGQCPFVGRTPTEIALKHLQTAPAPPRVLNPEIPAFVEHAILRALAKDPAARQTDVAEFWAELSQQTHRIVIPIAQEREDALPEFVEDVWASDATVEHDRAEVLSPVPRRRWRTAVAAAVVMLLVGAGLLARQLNKREMHLPTLSELTGKATPALTPTPTGTVGPIAPGSDADALEMAARLSQTAAATGLPMGTANPLLTADSAFGRGAGPGASQSAPVSTRNGASASHSTPAKTDAVQASPPMPKTPPQTPPAPAPTVAIARAPVPQSQPDLAEAPRRDSAAAEAAPRKIRPREPEGPPTDGFEHRRETAANAARQPASVSSADDAEDQDDERHDSRAESEQVGPKLIQWNGPVNRERVIKIEMPGVPGTLEIPRVYRDRVAIVEPPASSNQWRCAVLRVYGRGGVSFVMRWWPLVGRGVRFTAHR